MNPKALMLLKAISDHDGIRGAARVLGLSPSTISRQIKLYSEELGLTLIDRVDGRMELTEAGAALMRMGAEHEATWKRAVEAFRLVEHGSQDVPVIQLGSFSSAQRFAIVDAARLLRHITAYRLHLTAVEPEQSRTFLNNASLDAVVSVAEIPSKDNNLGSYPLWRERFLLLGTRNLLIQVKEIGLRRSLATFPWISPPARSVWFQYYKQFFRKLEINPHVIGRSNEWSAVQHMAAELEAVAMVPATTYFPQGLLVTVPINRALLPTSTVTLLAKDAVWLPDLLNAIARATWAAVGRLNGDVIPLLGPHLPAAVAARVGSGATVRSVESLNGPTARYDGSNVLHRFEHPLSITPGRSEH
jgi:DNA-binding transcriptional LysR family regulator